MSNNNEMEKSAVEMTRIALQQFFEKKDVRLEVEFYSDGRVKRVVAEETNTKNANIDIKDDSKEEMDIMQLVTDFLHDIGFPPHLKGYNYIRTAIIMCVNNPNLINQITKVLYPEIADKYNTIPTRVERGIRHSIEVSWERGNIKKIDEIFGYTISYKKGKPTNAEFIAMITDYVKVKLKNF